jgi:hypothetical protein
MKKLLLSLSVILGSIAIFPSVSTASVAGNSASGQVVYVRSGQPGWRARRSVIQTRVVWRYGSRYRETYRITYRPNGMTRTQLIGRVRLSGGIYRRY